MLLNLHKLKPVLDYSLLAQLFGVLTTIILQTDSSMAASSAENVFQTPKEGGKLVESNTKFALELLRQLSKEQPENVFMSPASISIAMGMTHLGARGKSAEEVGQVMGFNAVSANDLHQCFADLRKALHGSDKFQLHTANRLFGQKTYKFLEEYLAKTKEHYAAELAAMDFSNAAEQARQEINQWVEGQTNKKIKDLLPQGAIDDLTRLVLVNAIYFKGDWKNKFDSKVTNEAEFHVSDTEKIKLPLMYKKADFKFGLNRALECQALELPYVEDRLSMFILLPDPRLGVEDLLSKLELKDLLDIEGQFKMHKKKVEVYVPRFKLEQSFSMKETLAALGIKEIFSDNADLSGMDGTRELYVTKVLHKAFIEVNEEGSEAAAATAVVVALRSMPMRLEFRVDRPFVFMIRDNLTKSVLFLGKVVRPTPAPNPKGKDEL